MKPKAILWIAILIFPIGLAMSGKQAAAEPSAFSVYGNTFYVAVSGSDPLGDGSAGNPWATITHALENVPDNSLVLVGPGTYNGRVRLKGVYTQGVIVRSEVPYQARLRHTSTVVTCFYGQGITLEGFDIAHEGPGSGALVIQIQDLIGTPGGIDHVRDIVLRDNVIHDSYNNDLVKVNNGAGDILIEGNLFYNQEGHDEHIDVNSVTNVVIQDNVFFNDFSGSGRANNNDTGSFIVIKDSNGTDDSNVGSLDITVRRNVFLNWEGSTGSNFVLIGEDGNPYYEAKNVIVENNLLLGNSANVMRAPFGVKGGQQVTFRHNTVVGNLPALAYAMRLNQEGSNPANDQIYFYNNVWSDPETTMGAENDSSSNDFSDTPFGQTTSNWALQNNHYWNGGSPVPFDSGELINYTDDSQGTVSDPALPSFAGLILPRWNPGSGAFADGSADIRQVFERLVISFGVPASNSPLIDQAEAANAPADDILRHPRPVGGDPDIGAVEIQDSGFSLALSPSAQAIEPGGQAAYLVQTASIAGFSDPISLIHGSPPVSLTLSLKPGQIFPGQWATLMVTSTHAGPISPGLFYSLPITATSTGITHTASASLLIGGSRAYLPTLSVAP